MARLEEQARSLDAFVASDSPYQRRARILQALWREEMEYPLGLHSGRSAGPPVVSAWPPRMDIRTVTAGLRHRHRIGRHEPEGMSLSGSSAHRVLDFSIAERDRPLRRLPRSCSFEDRRPAFAAHSGYSRVEAVPFIMLVMFSYR